MGGRNSCQKEGEGRPACVRDVKTGEWGGGLRRAPDVAMVQATNFGNLHDLPDLGSLDWPPIRRIFLEGKVSSCPVIVREVGSQQAAQVAFAQDENVIETLAPDRPMSRSAKGFCHGLWGAVNTSRMRMPFTRCRKA